MFNLKKSIIVVAVAALACASFGQGRGGGFFGRMGGGLMPITFLVGNPSVQTELKLTDDQKTKITDFNTSFRQQMRDKFQADQGDQAQLSKDMQALNEDAKKQIDAILTDDQKKRIHEIQIQAAGNSAIMDKDVQASLDLTDEQKTKIETLNKNAQEAQASLRQKMQDGSLDRQEAFTTMQKNNDTLKEELGKVLTDAQKAKLKELGGAPFKLEMPQRRGGGGGR